MATYNWSSLTNEQVITFVPGTDQLFFDDEGISAADIFFDSPDGLTSVFSYDGTTITLEASPYSLVGGTSGDPAITGIRFQNGSLFIVGDNTTGTVNDDAANTIAGDVGDDFLVGAGGADTVFGGDGNDVLIVVGDGSTGVYGADTLDGGGNSDTLVYVDAEFGVTVALSGSTASTATGGDGVSTLTLLNIENVIGTGHNDSIRGSNAANYIEGGDGSDTVAGGGNADTANDTLRGGDGDDFLRQTRGDDFIDGGAGIDRLIFDSTITDGAVVNLHTGTSDAGGGNIATLVGIENVSGSEFADLLIGDRNANRLQGEDGDDTLDGGAGDDTLEGLDGNDTLNGAGQRDSLVGGGGDDSLSGGGGVDTMAGGTGDDTFIVNATDELAIENPGEGTADWVFSATTYTLSANVENLTLTGAGNINATGNTQNNLLTGFTGRNRITGGGGADTMAGGLGNDIYAVDSTDDVVIENPDEGTIDLVQSTVNHSLTANVENLTLLGAALQGTGNTLDNVILGTSGTNTLDGGEGNDRLDGSTGADTLIGGDGDDTLIGGGGIDSMVGGLGNDTYDLNSTNDKVVEASGGGTDDLIQSSVSMTLALLAEVEHLTLTGTASNNGTGNALNNRITGNSGNNTLDGVAGADTMDGGDGDDTFFVDSLLDVVLEAGAGGTGDHVFSAVDFALSNVENLTLTGTGNINGTGNSSNNVMTGNSGNNFFNGGAGEDSFSGGAGDDTYVVNSAGDAVTENPGGGTADLVQSSISYTLGAEVENLTLTAGLLGTGNGLANSIVGNSSGNTLDGAGGNDTIDGAGGIDTLVGGGGDDSLVGGGGIDSMVGGAGNDTYVVNATTESATENPGEGTADLVQSSATFTLGANVENLTLTGAGNIGGTGNTEGNLITGNGGNNTLNGLDGSDTLDGAVGVDVLNGGNHDDVMIWDAADSSINGGTETVADTLRLSGEADINLTGISDTLIQNVEVIDLVSGAGANVVTLAYADVLAISSTTNTLTINGNSSDQISAADSASWIFDSFDGTYFTYTQTQASITATLRVDADLQTNLIN
jgi:Ca2+-binding RTX toxin-like protein